MATPVIPLNNPARRVLAHLRHGPMTVEELANKMHVTANAVRNQLARLEEDNLVVRSGTRPGVSKPSVVYSITLEGQAQFSTIYLPVLSEFLRTTERESSERELISFMRDTGKSLAGRYPKATGTVKDRVNAAARLLKSFGGIPQVRSRNGSFVIESLGCPLAALTSENLVACRILEGLISEHIGSRARMCCIRDPAPRCCFEVAKKGDQTARA
jgi:DeoR family transcriptional regulator, suf operon transcriptional repressor